MARVPRFSTLAVNTKADAEAALLNGGYLRIYAGTQPASADDPITTQLLLAELRFQSPAFGAAANGIATARLLTSDPAARADGLATWCRAVRSDGTSTVCDGSVGLSGADVNLSNTSILAGMVVSVSAFTLTEPKG